MLIVTLVDIYPAHGNRLPARLGQTVLNCIVLPNLHLAYEAHLLFSGFSH